MQVGLFAGLVIAVYLIVLNGFLDGQIKGKIDAVLSSIVLGLIAIIFLVFDWKAGLTSIAVCFIAAGIVRPFARRTAIFIYSHPPRRKH